MLTLSGCGQVRGTGQCKHLVDVGKLWGQVNVNTSWMWASQGDRSV